MRVVSVFEFLDITDLEVVGLLVLSLVLTVVLTAFSLGFAWVWRRWRG